MARVRAAAAWCVPGFIGGAIFWHLIGFWTFVSDAVLDRTPQAAAHLAAAHLASPAMAADGAASVSLVYHVDPANCTGLEFDRTSNVTFVSPCPDNGMALRLMPLGDREDMAALTEQSVQAAGYRAD